MATFTKRVSKTTKKTSYKVQIRRKGYPTMTATFDRKIDAQKWSTDREAELNQNQHFGYATAKNHKLHDVIERYIKEVMPHKTYDTSRGQIPQLEWWQQHLGNLTLAEITSNHIVKARSSHLETPNAKGKCITNTTANRYMSALSHVYTIAIKEWAYTKESPVAAITPLPEPEDRVRYLSDDERVALLSACEASTSFSLYPIVFFAIASGCRLSEITGMKWNDVQFDNELIVIPKTKNKNRHTFTLSDATLPLLKILHENRDPSCPWLFPNKKNNGPISIRKAFETAIKRAGIEDFTFHDLRHTAASYLAMSGASTVELAAALNHKTLQMVQRYAHLSQPHSAKILKNMNKKFLGGGNDKT